MIQIYEEKSKQLRTMRGKETEKIIITFNSLTFLSFLSSPVTALLQISNSPAWRKEENQKREGGLWVYVA